jgi:hypothetical protein
MVCALLATAGGAVRAQVDTLFWFVAPSVAASHGDSPVYLRFATFGAPAVITVTAPANPTFVPLTVNLAANAVNSLNLATYLAAIENQPANTVLNKGLRIHATANISAYYEVTPSCSCNPDIFTLKGENALGTSFRTPFQTVFANGFSTTSGFDIVATEANTTVTITPTKALVGHPAGVPFTVVLPQAGSTWSGRALSAAATEHPTGTVVTSNKPIAITVTDDSVGLEQCWDILGDQIVPVPLAGTEYVAIKGSLNTPDRVFLVPTQPGTQIFLNGSLQGTFNPGTNYTHQLSTGAAYYTSSAPVYAWHVTGFGCEVGGALLPPIQCTGSQEVAFIRSTAENFGMKILVPAGGEDDFEFNGNPNQIPATAFLNVPGTNGAWKYANLTNVSFVQVLAASRVVNTTSFFHLGIVNGGNTTGCRYGYFSDFAENRFEVSTPVGEGCVGEPFTLEASEITGASYTWTGPDGFTSTSNPYDFGALALSDTGTYVISGFVGTCPIESDTMQLLVHALPDPPVLSAPEQVCAGDTLIVSTAVQQGMFYLWQGPSGNLPNVATQTFPAASAAQNGVFTLTLSDHGCVSAPSTVAVNVVPTAAALVDGEDVVVCEGAPWEVEALGAGVWAWTLPDGSVVPGAGVGSGAAVAGEAGVYVLGGLVDGCAVLPDSVEVVVLAEPEPPVVAGPAAVCAGDAGVWTVSVPAGAEVVWSGPGGAEVVGEELAIGGMGAGDAGTYAVLVSVAGCTSSATAFEVEVVEPVPASVGGDAEVEVCAGEPFSFGAVPEPGAQWVWQGPVGANGTGVGAQWSDAAAAAGDAGWYVLGGVLDGCPMLQDSVALVVNPIPAAPVLSGAGTYCEGDGAVLQAVAGGPVVWSGPAGAQAQGQDWTLADLEPGMSGTYAATTEVSGCISPAATLILNVVALPESPLSSFESPPTVLCPDEVAEFVVPFYDAAYSAAWTFTAPGGSPVPFGTGPGTTSVGDGLYTVVLETGAPCFLEAVGSFTAVTDICDLLIPNVITPNGDDFNAAFKIPGLHRLPGTRCTVFNRWGTALYVHEDFGAAEGWAPEPDGTAEGTYFYELLLPVTGGSLRIADASGVREVTLDRPVRLTGILTVLR